MSNPRAADDFDVIRAHLDRIKRRDFTPDLPKADPRKEGLPQPKTPCACGIATENGACDGSCCCC